MTETYFNRGKVKYLGNPLILRLGEIIRYNNRFKIRRENVAEHTMYVANTVLQICKLYNIDPATKAKALEFAVIHDIPEAITGDVGYDTKEDSELLRAALEKSELRGLEESFPEHLESYQQFLAEEKQETVAAIIVKLADTVSVLQYSTLELQLGNRTNDMTSIYENSQERVAKLIEKLEDKLEKLSYE